MRAHEREGRRNPFCAALGWIATMGVVGGFFLVIAATERPDLKLLAIAVLGIGFSAGLTWLAVGALLWRAKDRVRT